LQGLLSSRQRWFPFDLLLDEFHAFVNAGVQSFNSQGNASFRTSPAAGGEVNGLDVEKAFERIQFREDHPVGNAGHPDTGADRFAKGHRSPILNSQFHRGD
jgi:hypothetical protein